MKITTRKHGEAYAVTSCPGRSSIRAWWRFSGIGGDEVATQLWIVIEGWKGVPCKLLIPLVPKTGLEPARGCPH